MVTPTCPDCGGPLPADAPGGMCPRCLLNLGFPSAPPPVGAEPTRVDSPASPARPSVTRSGSEREQPGSRIGRYKLLEPIGEGGFGTVWMAEQFEPLRRKVALKIIKLGMDTKEVVARFDAERQALALMDHPNIARVFDGGATDTGRPYFVMELVKGVRLTEYCDTNQLSTEARLQLFIEVCQAVQHAHQKGVIHRDLKPNNVLVTEQDGRAVPKVIDFGIAKATGTELTEKTLFTRFNQVIGTPAYMSPEQAGLGSLDIDTRSDVYSLGVLLYELLTGRTPFSNEEMLRAALDEVLRTIREKEPSKPSTRLSALTPHELQSTAQSRGVEPGKLSRLVRGELDWIVMKCLEKDRARRYETANGLARDLERYLHNEPVAAAAPSVAYQLAKLARRHRAALAVSSAFLAVVLLGAATSLWQAAEATRRADAESQARRYAQQQERIARQMLEVAEKQREENRQRLVRVNVASGVHRLEEGDAFAALPWFAEALGLDGGVPAREQSHRLRIGTALKYAPRLVHNWFHDGPVSHAEFSPDGAHVLSSSEDGTARVWEVSTGRMLASLPHTGKVRQAFFSAAGTRVITVCAATAQVWDWLQARTVAPSMTHAAAITVARFSPDDLRILTASKDRTARIWDAKTGEPLGLPFEHDGEVRDAAWSPDGRWLATIGTDSRVRVWEADGRLRTTIPGVGRYVYSVRFSEDGRRVLWSSWGKARVCDAQLGTPVTPVLSHAQAVRSALFSPDETRILTASEDQTAQLWDAFKGTPIGPPIQHDHSLHAAEFSPDGNAIITAGEDGTARIYDVNYREAVCAPLRHSGRLVEARFSPDGAQVLTAGVDGMVRVWDVATSGMQSLVLKHRDLVRQIGFSLDSGLAATASNDKTAALWNPRTGRPVAVLQHDRPVVDLAFSPDGRRVATASLDGTARLWDATTGAPAGPRLQADGPLARLAFTTQGQSIVTAGGDEVSFLYVSKRVAVRRGPVRVQTWNLRDGQPTGPSVVLDGSREFAEFSPDGGRVATPCTDDSVRIWSCASGKELLQIAPGSRMTLLRFSSDGHRLVTANGDVSDYTGTGQARVWNADTGAPLTPPLPHRARVQAVAFSTDGRWVVTGSQDGTARVWNAATGEALTPPLVHNYHVFDVAFSPDGRAVLTGSGDRTARVWDAATGELLGPPLRHLGFVFHVAFAPDNRTMLTSLEQSHIPTRLETTAHVWELVSDPRPVEDLRLLAQLLSGHRIDSTSSLVPLDPEAFRKDWAVIRAKYPEEFTPPMERKLAWHEREARWSEETRRWTVAARHLRQMTLARPGDELVSNRLAQAEREAAQLGQTLRQTHRAPARGTNESMAVVRRTASTNSTAPRVSPPGTTNRPARGPATGAVTESNFELLARDDFNGSTRLPWEILWPDPTHVNLTNQPGYLTIIGQPSGLIAPAPANGASGRILARNLHLLTNAQPAEVPLMITTCIVGFQPTEAYHQAGLLAYEDADSYLKLTAEYHPSTGGARIVRLYETNAKPRLVGGTQFPRAPERLWLRMIKDGNRFSYYYSLDGQTFELEGSGTWGNGRPKHLGLLAKTGGSAAEFNAHFDFFEVRRRVPR